MSFRQISGKISKITKQNPLQIKVLLKRRHNISKKEVAPSISKRNEEEAQAVYKRGGKIYLQKMRHNLSP